jgi:hypothetical protein
MIKNASEMLTAFIAAEREKVDSIDMPHMPTLGSAYEAIANAGIENSFVLPPNLDLRVVSGFISGIPNQIDGMLVRGEGQRYGLTDQYIYPIEQVLCVLEVKKTLNKADLVDGISHLAAVQRLFVQNFSARYEAGEHFEFDLARESFEKITGRAGPRSSAGISALSPTEQLIFGILARQLYAPITVLLGFDGYSTERGLREAMLDIVESNAGPDSNASPDILPSLITAGSFTLVKCTGRPYLACGAEDEWVVLASARHNVARILLEFLWTKISMFFNVRMPFGLDMDHENLKELLLAKGVILDGKVSLHLRSASFSEKYLQRPAVTLWQPAKLSSAAVYLAESASFLGGCLQLNKSLGEYIKKNHCIELGQAITELVKTNVFSINDDLLQVVSSRALIASFDDGTGYADLDGERLQSWCDEQGLEPYYVRFLMLDESGR